MHDPRLTPARGDLAAKYLEGKVEAARFVAGEEFEISEAIAPLRSGPSADARTLDRRRCWASASRSMTATAKALRGASSNGDGYVGWLPDRALAKPGAPATHKVTAISTFAFPGPSIKLPPVETLVMGTTLTVIA